MKKAHVPHVADACNHNFENTKNAKATHNTANVCGEPAGESRKPAPPGGMSYRDFMRLLRRSPERRTYYYDDSLSNK